MFHGLFNLGVNNQDGITKENEERIEEGGCRLVVQIRNKMIESRILASRINRAPKKKTAVARLKWILLYNSVGSIRRT